MQSSAFEFGFDLLSHHPYNGQASRFVKGVVESSSEDSFSASTFISKNRTIIPLSFSDACLRDAKKTTYNWPRIAYY